MSAPEARGLEPLAWRRHSEEARVQRRAPADDDPQEAPRDHDRAEHAHRDADGERNGEAHHDAGPEVRAEPVENAAGNQGGEVRVANRGPRAAEASVDGG